MEIEKGIDLIRGMVFGAMRFLIRKGLRDRVRIGIWICDGSDFGLAFTEIGVEESEGNDGTKQKWNRQNG